MMNAKQTPNIEDAPMSVEHTSRRGRTWYLHVKTTAAGKSSYFFSMNADGQLVPAIPDGYEVYENVNGQVFLRKKTAQTILPKELAFVEGALHKHTEYWRYRAEIKKNAIIVHETGDMSGLDGLSREFRGRPLADNEMLPRAHYMAMLRFTLADKKSRFFVTERFCFRGSIDDWIQIGGPAPLAVQLRQFVKHLGRESFYELF